MAIELNSVISRYSPGRHFHTVFFRIPTFYNNLRHFSNSGKNRCYAARALEHKKYPQNFRIGPVILHELNGGIPFYLFSISRLREIGNRGKGISPFTKWDSLNGIFLNGIEIEFS